MTFNLQWHEYVLVALIVLVIVVVAFLPLLFLVRLWERRHDHRFGGASIDGRWEFGQAAEKLQRQFDHLKSESAREKAEAQVEITSLKSQVKLLFEQWEETIKKLGVVEVENKGLQAQITTLQSAQARVQQSTLLTPLLLVCGDQSFCEADADRLNQSGIFYRTLADATKSDVEDELQRRRFDNSLYWWVHISAHGSREGIELADGIADARFWNRQLEGVRVVFLASCDGPEVGDLLVGVVRRVIVFYGDIQSETAALFTLSFWRAKKRLLDADLAYEQAIREVPAARPFVDIRRTQV